MDDKCALCGRENELTFHHLIPRTLHKNKWFKKNFTREEMNHGVDLCKYECHREVHNLISEKEMGRSYNTLEKLKRHPKVKKYIKFIKNK